MDTPHGDRIDVKRTASSAPPVPDELLPTAGSVVAPHHEAAKRPEEPAVTPEAAEPQEDEGTDEADNPVNPNEDTDNEAKDDAAAAQPPTAAKVGSGRRRHFWRWFAWIAPLVVVLLAAAALAVPTSRYPILALFLKRPFTVSVVDSKTNTPVSGATVTLDGVTQHTGSNGKADFAARVGKRVVQITMKYYQSMSMDVFVGIKTGQNSTTIQLDATGRQVPVMVTNKITGKAVANATVKVLDTSATTDASGKATIVLPTTAATQGATITASGYNEASAQVQVTDQVVAANTFSLVPAGQVYFLSNQSGHIDVVSTNLDGSNRATVLAGTGSEDPTYTILLASRDWKYLALLSRRDGGNHAKLFLINTATSKATVMDTTTADYTMVGWSNHTFVYRADLYANNAWQPGGNLLRSYNADTGQVATIDQTTAAGTQASYIYSYFGYAQIVSDRVVYGFGWNDYNSNYAPNNLGGQKISMMSANVDGTNKTDLRDISIPNGTTYAYATALMPSPQTVNIETAIGSQSPVFYTYQYQNNTVSQSNTITSASFGAAQQAHVNYLLSPSGSASLWGAVLDGKNTLFVGDASGANGNQIATQSDYGVYGWYTDSYVLVQKGNNELDIMPASGGTPQKISSYFRPDVLVSTNLSSGYGGL